MRKQANLVNVVGESEWFVQVEINENGGLTWSGFFVYISCDDRVREQQLQGLLGLLQNVRAGMCIMGDFNDILESGEKGALLDLGYSGSPLTWGNRRAASACIKIRLDRVLCTASWCLNFHNASVSHLPLVRADHCTVLLDTEAGKVRAKRRFVFDKRWVGKDGCEGVIREAWSKQVGLSRWFQICEKIKNNLNSRVRIDDLQAKLQACYVDDDFERGVLQIQKELSVAWADEEVYWQTKTRN
ncbi:hypothetical protein LIER_20271 [Lithospermum erythrorhizon]|uniref:Uncharacterized protein n=1 Tax=Lithospermum erythrorhizon TaxID=34254 RepID=A0AAV3QNM4_LITER